MAKTYEEILDDMCRRVKECNAMEGSFIYTALAPFAMELALDRGLIPNQATHAVGIGKFDVEIPIGSKFSINIGRIVNLLLSE